MNYTKETEFFDRHKEAIEKSAAELNIETADYFEFIKIHYGIPGFSGYKISEAALTLLYGADYDPVNNS